MADSEPTVRVSGIVLASLMFQHVNSDSDAEGLILGESRFEEQITISDSQADQIHIEEIYNIQKHIGCRGVSAFYNGVGDIAADAIDRILADNKQERLIGWYRQRRNSDQQMTFREKVVHERLKASLSNPHMIFLLLTPSIATATGSTHRMEYAAFLSRSRRFLNVPVSVTNLGVLEQLAYWRASAPCSALGYDLAMKKHSSIFFSSDGLLRDVNAVNAMNECLQAELQAASRKLEDSERLLETLQEEVSALRREITEKTRSSAGRGLILFFILTCLIRLTSLTSLTPLMFSDEGPTDDRKQRLHAAFRALLACSPLAHTHTLTLDALPVPDACCRAKQGEQDAVSTATPTHCPDTASVQETLQGRNGCRKRAREATPGGQEKQEELELRIRRSRRTFPVETP